MRRALAIGIGWALAAPAWAVHFGGGSWATPSGVGPPDVTPVAACPAALEVAYDSLWDVHRPPDPASSAPVVYQLGAFDQTRVLGDLVGGLGDVTADPLLVADYEFVVMLSIPETPGGVNPGYDYGGTLAKNLGFSNAYYDAGPLYNRRPTWWTSLVRAPHLNGIEHWRSGAGASADPATVVLHQLAHGWGVEYAWDTAFGYPAPSSWTPGDSPGYLAAERGHWRLGWAGDASGIMGSRIRGAMFNAFDLYALGLMPYAEAAGYTYEVSDTAGGLHPVVLDDLIDVLQAKGTQYHDGDGTRFPATDPGNASLQALVVLVRGRGDAMTADQEAWLCDLVDGLPAAWSAATWGRSTLTVGPPASTPVDEPPVAGDDAEVVTAGYVLEVAAPGVLANDADPEGDALVPVLAQDVAHGALTLAADGGYRYVPDAGFVGTDTFSYTVTDGAGAAATAVVTLTVAPDTPTVVSPFGPDASLTFYGGSTVAVFQLDVAAPLRVQLFDRSGAVLHTFVDGPMPAGAHAVRMGEGVTAAGRYDVEVQIGSRVRAGRIRLEPWPW